MIWGDVINAVRSLHLELIEQFNFSTKAYALDIELDSAKILVYPKSKDDFEEWEWPVLPPSVQDSLEFHSVERALIEGPLLPIEKVQFPDIRSLDLLRGQIMNLELEWLQKAKLASPEVIHYIENSLKTKWLKLQTQAGFNRLKAV